MEFRKLIRFNEWWSTKRVNPAQLKPHKRPLYFTILDYLNKRQILLITGLRRVGKTTLIHQLIQYLLDEGTKETTIVYFSFDEESVDFEDFIKTYEDRILKNRIDAGKVYVFLDEIQKCKDWQNRIKIHYDLYPSVKFVISGSASVQISRKAKESLAGRIFDFVLEPLSFKEFLEWRGFEIDIGKAELYERKAFPLFNDYLRKGGFPELVNENDEDVIKNYIRNNVVERIIYRDMPQEFGIKDYELLKTLIEMIARNPGMIVNYDALSRDLKRSKKTIMDYFFYLEYAMVIRLVANYRPGFLVSSRKSRKAYVNSTALSFAFADDFYSDKSLERVAENLAVIEANAKNYYRNKHEVDIILKPRGKLLPIEVKYGLPDDKGIRKFLTDFKLRRGIILTRDTSGRRRLNGKEIILVPLWIFALSKERYLRV